MTYKTHETVGLATVSTAIFLVSKTGIQLDTTQMAMTLASGVVASILPDIDSKRSKTHKIATQVLVMSLALIIALNGYSIFVARNGFHFYRDLTYSILYTKNLLLSVVFIVLVSTGYKAKHRGYTHSILYAILTTITIYLITNNIYITSGFAIGILSHDIIDIVNKKKVHYLWPIGKGFCLGWFDADGKVAALVNSLFGVLFVVTMYLNTQIVW